MCWPNYLHPHLEFQLAGRNKSKHPFSKDTAFDGEVLSRGFGKRHPELSMRTPEAEFAVKSQPFNKNYEYNLFFARECHGWKEVNTAGYLMRVQQGYQLFKEGKYIFLLVTGKSKVHKFGGTCCSVSCGDIYVCKRKCHVFHRLLLSLNMES
jgi:hypothetical protein